MCYTLQTLPSAIIKLFLSAIAFNAAKYSSDENFSSSSDSSSFILSSKGSTGYESSSKSEVCIRRAMIPEISVSLSVDMEPASVASSRCCSAGGFRFGISDTTTSAIGS